MTALKVLQLVDSDGHPEPVLESLVFAEGERRRSLLRGLLEDYYEPVFRLDLARASKSQFHEAFRSFGAREGVLTKCEAFFIRAAMAAGIRLSPYIMAGRHQGRRKQAGGKSAGRGRAVAQTGSASPATAAPATELSGESPGSVAPVTLVSTVAETSPRLAARLNVAEMILSKYPEFDPSWTAEVQSKWLDGMTKLYEGLAAAEKSDVAAGGE